MQANCPKCRAPFSLPDGWHEKIDCPNCQTQFQPVDERKLQEEQRVEIAEKILGYFQSINHPLANHVAQTLAEEPPLPGRGGYVQRETEIEGLMEKVLETGNVGLIEAVLLTFAEVQDWYFCHKLINRTVVSQAAEIVVADAAMKAPHLGGQSGDYFHLLMILAETHIDVREWCKGIQQKEPLNSILYENMELVLSGRA
ncbi:MAG: hypothetical protein IPL99_12200 [Candidatus Competibacteraceae bacterium]|nr:hypothetical protein [Candidatus Competibacteraceae bacterium]